MANDVKREVEEPVYDSNTYTEQDEGSWCMRRREASDDDDCGGSSDVGGDDKDVWNGNRSDVFGFDGELEDDGVGCAPEESDEEENSSGFDDVAEEVLVLKEKGKEQDREEKNAPIVPRVGAFYMHDDRFGRRMTSGRRKLREFKDERKWQHDKFEEMSLQQYKSKKFNVYTKAQRISDGHKGQYGNQARGYDVKANQLKHNFNNQSCMSRAIKGRGPVKYRPFKNSSYVVPAGNMETRKVPGMNSNADSAKALLHASEVGSDSLASKSKNMNHHADNSVAKQRDIRPRKTEGYFPGETSRLPHSNAHVQRTTDCTKKPIPPAAGRHYKNMSLQSSASTYTVESLQPRGQALDCSLPELMSYLSLTSSNQADNFSPIGCQHATQQMCPERAVSYPVKAYNQQFSSYSRIVPQSSFVAPSSSGYDLGDLESFANPRKSKMAWPGGGSGTFQGYGTGSPLGEIDGHQNFSTTTTVLPTMQFSDHLAVEDVSKAAVHSRVAQYMANCEIAFGNSGINRPSFLQDNIGCLPSNITPSGGYNAFSSEQDSTGILSSEPDAGIPSRPSDGTEVMTDQYRLQRIKPQRYSKMNFKR